MALIGLGAELAVTSSLKALGFLANTFNDEIPAIASGQVIARICQLLESSDRHIIEAAVKSLGIIFTSTEHSIIDTAILQGVLFKFEQILEKATDQNIKTLVLFALSNIAAGSAL